MYRTGHARRDPAPKLVRRTSTTNKVAIGTTTAVPIRFARSRSPGFQSAVAGQRRRIQFLRPEGHNQEAEPRQDPDLD